MVAFYDATPSMQCAHGRVPPRTKAGSHNTDSYLRMQALKTVTIGYIVVTLVYCTSHAAAEPLPSPKAGQRAPVRMEAGPKLWTDDIQQSGLGDHGKRPEEISPVKAIRAPARVLLESIVADAVQQLSPDGGVDASANKDRLAMVLLLTDLYYKSKCLGLRARAARHQRLQYPYPCWGVSL